MVPYTSPDFKNPWREWEMTWVFVYAPIPRKMCSRSEKSDTIFVEVLLEKEGLADRSQKGMSTSKRLLTYDVMEQSLHSIHFITLQEVDLG